MKKKKKKKNEEYKESQITTNIFDFILYIKDLILLENIVWKM